jgi:peptide/nickel transport system permease protein
MVTKKIVSSLLIFLGVLTLVFLMFQGLGDPSRLVAGQTGDQKTIDNIRKDLNLDKPKWKQFLIYLNDISPLAIHSSDEIKKKQLTGFFFGKDKLKFSIKLPYLGISYQSKKSTLAILSDALPGTFVLAISAMSFACFFGIFFGLISAYNKNKLIDKFSILASIVGISAPSFFLGVLIAYFFGFVLHDMTGLNLTGSLYEIDDLTGLKSLNMSNLILPSLTLGIRPLAIIMQLTRSSMLDTLSSDFTRTAYAKGVSTVNIILKHALPNALNPVITAITGWFAELLAGSFFIEYIFGWHGIGKVTVDALDKLDYPIVIGVVLVCSFLFILINLISDMIYHIVDPRVKF